MAILWVLVAAIFVALSNLAMRKSVDAGGTAKAFIVFQMGVAFLVAILLNPVRTGNYSINSSIIGLGITAGLVFALMIYSLGRAIEKGPPGITFSILNAATVMPGLVMALLFGAVHGFIYNGWHGFGSMLVLGGLFWAGKGMQGMQDKRNWIFFSIAMFSLHVVLLSLFQWRALLLNLPHPEELASFFTSVEIKSEWFVPFMYLVSTVIQLGIYLKVERRMPKAIEVAYGICGGAANSLCTFFLIWATEVATPLENAIIFPIFSVVGIVLSNIWGQKLYQEQVNWRACQLCAFGLIIGTVDWKSVAAAIGF
ncbi:MAG TPA: hypothetical protein VLE89_00725 [Chlamydiales bacterium]|nr:hypothetical protein [Chlamydiales bacterium]